MKRRHILSTVGTSVAAISGCAGAVGRLGTSNAFPDLSVKKVKDFSDEGFELTVEILEQFDADYPAELRISLTNLLDSHRDFIFGPAPPFNDFWGTHEESSALLLIVPYIVIDAKTVAGRSIEEYERQYSDHVFSANVTDPEGDHSLVPDEPIENCWKGLNRLAINDVGLHLEMEPGETVTEEYIVLADWENESCLPAGEYQFGPAILSRSKYDEIESEIILSISN